MSFTYNNGFESGALPDRMSEMGAAVARKIDDVVCCALDGALGFGCWKFDAMCGRLERHIFADGVEVIMLDGAPLVTLHPIQYEELIEHGSWHMRATRAYQLWKAPTTPVPPRKPADLKREPMPVKCEICQWRGKRIKARSAPCPACGSRVEFS
jgi:hypothetical protein